jgi:hypothetical protein
MSDFNSVAIGIGQGFDQAVNNAGKLQQMGQSQAMFTKQQAIADMQLKALQEKQALENKELPLDVVFPKAGINDTRDQEYLSKQLEQFIVNSNGIPKITLKHIPVIQSIMTTPQFAENFGRFRLDNAKSDVDAIGQEINAYQEKSQGKDLAQDKNFLALQQKYNQAVMKRTALDDNLNKIGSIMSATLKEYGADVVNRLNTGEISWSDLSKIPTLKMREEAAKQEERRRNKIVDKSIPLGDRTRVYYTDGTYEDISKGISPGTASRSSGGRGGTKKDNVLVKVLDEETGNTIYVPRSQAAGRQAPKTGGSKESELDRRLRERREQTGKKDKYGYVIGEVRNVRGRNYKYIGNDQWQ